jgi:protein-disulfide isomerase
MVKESGPGVVGERSSRGSAAAGGNSARQKVVAARQAEAVGQRRRRQLVIGSAVVAVIALAVTVGLAVQGKRASADAAIGSGPFVAPAGAVGEGKLAIPFGAPGVSGAAGASQGAKVTLTIYEDFRCPYCRMAEAAFEPVYKPYAQAGKIAVQYHLVDLIDRNLGGTGSLRAGNAGACAQDAGMFEAYHDVFYANQPEETNDAYGSNATLFSLAAQVPGLSSPAFRACVNAGTHGSWVKRNYDSLNTLLAGSVSTPYYAINGRRYNMPGQTEAAQQGAFKAALDDAIAAASR